MYRFAIFLVKLQSINFYFRTGGKSPVLKEMKNILVFLIAFVLVIAVRTLPYLISACNTVIGGAWLCVWLIFNLSEQQKEELSHQRDGS